MPLLPGWIRGMSVKTDEKTLVIKSKKDDPPGSPLQLLSVLIKLSSSLFLQKKGWG